MDLNQILLLITVFLILAIFLIGGLLFTRGLKRKGQITRALNMGLFLISLPKKVKPRAVLNGNEIK